eukprot:jgi/Bigna1/73531/fgenesh1_pg.24_\
MTCETGFQAVGNLVCRDGSWNTLGFKCTNNGTCRLPTPSSLDPSLDPTISGVIPSDGCGFLTEVGTSCNFSCGVNKEGVDSSGDTFLAITKGTEVAKRYLQLKVQAQCLQSPITASPSTLSPSTYSPQTNAPSTTSPTTGSPSTPSPASLSPKTQSPSTETPSTISPTTAAPTQSPLTIAPSSLAPSHSPSSISPTSITPTISPSSLHPYTVTPSLSPSSRSPQTHFPTSHPSTTTPTSAQPTLTPSTSAPTQGVVTPPVATSMQYSNYTVLFARLVSCSGYVASTAASQALISRKGIYHEVLYVQHNFNAICIVVPKVMRVDKDSRVTPYQILRPVSKWLVSLVYLDFGTPLKHLRRSSSDNDGGRPTGDSKNGADPQAKKAAQKEYHSKFKFLLRQSAKIIGGLTRVKRLPALDGKEHDVEIEQTSIRIRSKQENHEGDKLKKSNIKTGPKNGSSPVAMKARQPSRKGGLPKMPSEEKVVSDDKETKAELKPNRKAFKRRPTMKSTALLTRAPTTFDPDVKGKEAEEIYTHKEKELRVLGSVSAEANSNSNAPFSNNTSQLKKKKGKGYCRTSTKRLVYLIIVNILLTALVAVCYGRLDSKMAESKILWFFVKCLLVDFLLRIVTAMLVQAMWMCCISTRRSGPNMLPAGRDDTKRIQEFTVPPGHVGFTIHKSRVVRVSEKSPAYRAGIQEGFRLISVNGVHAQSDAHARALFAVAHYTFPRLSLTFEIYVSESGQASNQSNKKQQPKQAFLSIGSPTTFVSPTHDSTEVPSIDNAEGVPTSAMVIPTLHVGIDNSICPVSTVSGAVVDPSNGKLDGKSVSKTPRSLVLNPVRGVHAQGPTRIIGLDVSQTGRKFKDSVEGSSELKGQGPRRLSLREKIIRMCSPKNRVQKTDTTNWMRIDENCNQRIESETTYLDATKQHVHRPSQPIVRNNFMEKIVKALSPAAGDRRRSYELRNANRWQKERGSDCHAHEEKQVLTSTTSA